MKVLIVDDDAMNRKVLRAVLATEGHTVLESEDGVAALQTLEQEKVDAVISDVLMPRMDGYRLCYEVRKNPTFNSLPFIAYTATYTSLSDEKVALEFGADKFIRKPASPEIIINAVQEAVECRATRATPLQLADESLAMREYSEALVRKLEETNLKLAEANNTLALSENHIRTVLESAPECITIIDRDGALVQINAAGLCMIEGDFAEQLLGKSVYPLIVPEHRQVFREITEAVLGGESRLLEFEIVGLKGARRWLQTHAVPLKNANGDIISSLGITRDITESRRADETLSKIFVKAVRYRRGRVFADLGAIFGLSAVVFGFSVYLELFQKFSDVILKAHSLVDDTVMTLVFLALAFVVFSYRRWSEIGIEVVARRQAEEALRTLHGELEVRVQERTANLAKSNEALLAEIAARKKAQEMVQVNMDRLRALHEIDVAITSSLDLRNRLTVLLEKIELFVPIAAASTVRLFNPETRNLESLACRGLDEEKWRSLAGTTLRGRAKQVVTTKAPVIIRDIGKDERTYNAEIFRGLISYLGVPLLAHGQILGVLTLYTAKEHEFTEEEIEFFTTLADQAAIAIHNAELYEQTKNQADQLTERERIQRTLKELSQDITAMEVDELLEKLTVTIRELFKADIADMRFLGKERWEKILISIAGKTEWLPEGVEFGGGANLWVVKQRRSIAIRDYSQPGEFKPGRVSRRFAIRGFLAAPLIGRQGEVLGVVRALTKEARDFTPQEIDLFEQIANGAAIAIENSRLYGELQISNKVKSEFLGVMSHELRTPLNVITGYSSLLKQDLAARGDVDGQSALNKIDSQAKILLRLINTIMEATMIESGRSTFTKQRLDICKLVDQLKSENDLPKDSEITLAWHIAESLPVLHTDGQKLQSILHHLIDSAIKFTERGTVTISVRTTERHVEFCVTDTGVGIPAENLPSIFKIFKQGDSSDTRSFEGVGLGLYIANKYAELLGGSINVKSKVGAGSIFTLAVPLTV